MPHNTDSEVLFEYHVSIPAEDGMGAVTISIIVLTLQTGRGGPGPLYGLVFVFVLLGLASIRSGIQILTGCLYHRGFIHYSVAPHTLQLSLEVWFLICRETSSFFLF